MCRATLLLVMIVVTTGCQNTRWQRDGRQSGGPFAQPMPVAPGFAPPNGQPYGVQPGPAAPFPTAPGPGANVNPAPPAPAAPFPSVTPNQPAGNAGPGQTSKFESHWQPAEARAPAKNPPRILLAPPEPLPEEPKTPATTPMAPGSGLPVGIPRFAYVKKGVASGLTPAPDDGLTWLKASQYRTVLHLRTGDGTNADAHRQATEKFGLRYVSLEVSPESLTKESVDQFFQLVRDGQQHPLFVFDRDGTLAGGLWYLWFRLGEELPDDVARIRARTLGLRDDGDEQQRAMWRAVERYLTDLKAR